MSRLNFAQTLGMWWRMAGVSKASTQRRAVAEDWAGAGWWYGQALEQADNAEDCLQTILEIEREKL
jgi:hypothetical protein